MHLLVAWSTVITSSRFSRVGSGKGSASGVEIVADPINAKLAKARRKEPALMPVTAKWMLTR